MKVHRYQIDVMWLFLATLFCHSTKGQLLINTQKIKNEKSVLKEPYNPIQIRPPPLGGVW